MRARRAIVVLFMAVAACAPATRLSAVWSAADTDVRFERVLVAALSADEARRRAIESAFTQRLANATPSHTLISGDQARDRDRARAVVAQEGFDGAIIARLVGVDPAVTSVPGTTYWGPAPYPSMWGYWGYGWTAVHEPGYLRSSRVVALESNVYAVPGGELLWSSRSETISPVSIDASIDAVVDSTVRQMKRRRVVR